MIRMERTGGGGGGEGGKWATCMYTSFWKLSVKYHLQTVVHFY